jgi:hypothetical protein
MKLSVGAVLAFAACVLAKPVLLNSHYEIQEDVPFTLKWNNAQGPVTITLMTGEDPDNLKKVTDLVCKRALILWCANRMSLTKDSWRDRRLVHLHP